MPRGGAPAEAGRPAARGNNLDLVRFVAAALVLVSHSYTLTGYGGEPALFAYGTLGGLAVVVFFLISGFLVTASWQRNPHLLAFARNRALRIMPALVVVVLLCVLVLGPWLTTLPLGEYLVHPQTRQYLANVTFTRLHYALPGVFADNPYANAVNGSLWTLPIEVAMYVGVALLALSGLLRRSAVLVLAIVLGVAWFGGGKDWIDGAAPHLPRVLPPSPVVQLGLWFWTGSVLWLFRDHVRYRGWIALLLLIAARLVQGTLPGALLLHVALPYAVFWFAQADLGQLRRFGRHGDFSYGMYLYAFPVQQTIAHFGGARWPFPVYIAVCLATTLVCAVASWHWIEAPALRLKHRGEARPAARTTGEPPRVGA